MQEFLMTVQLRTGGLLNPALITHVVRADNYHQAFARMVFAICPDMALNHKAINIATLVHRSELIEFVRLKHKAISLEIAEQLIEAGAVRLNDYPSKGIDMIANSLDKLVESDKPLPF